MAQRSAGRGGFDVPTRPQSGGMGIQDIMPFVGQMAMMNRMAQMSQIGQQRAASGQTPNPNLQQQGSEDFFGNRYGNPQYAANEEQFKDLLSKSESYGKASAVTSTVYPIMKSAYAQQAGQSGYIPGMVGQAQAKLGMANTDMIARLQTAFNEAKANFAQNYSGNQGISRLLEAFTEGNPTPTDSEQNAFGKLVTYKKAAYGIAKGVASAHYTSESLKNANPDEVVKNIGNPNNYISPREQQAIEDLSREEYKNASYLESPNLSSNLPIPPGLKQASWSKGLASIFPSGGNSENSDPLDKFRQRYMSK